jgi:hypothetical protein
MKNPLVQKQSKNSKSLIAAFALITSLMLSSSAHAKGVRDGGGGDAAEVEFSTIGKQLVTMLQAKGNVGFDLTALKSAVDATQISMLRHQLFDNGVERDAMNYPTEKQIEVNRAYWIGLQAVPKVELAFHEYLGIAGIEHDVYTVSSTLVNLLGVDVITKMAAQALPNLNYHCVVERENADDARVRQACGEADLTTSAIYNPSNPAEPFGSSYFFEACGQTEISITQMSGLGSGLDVELRRFKGANDKNWTSKEPFETSSFDLDIYSAPNSFSISLGIPSGGLFHRHTEQYDATCTMN